jgi:hypothetical protein
MVLGYKIVAEVTKTSYVSVVFCNYYCLGLVFMWTTNVYYDSYGGAMAVLTRS